MSARADNCPPVRSIPTQGCLMRSGSHLFPECRGTTTIACRMARPEPWGGQQMATCRRSRALQFFARAKIVVGPQQSNLEFSSRRKSPSERKKGQRALTITPTGDAAFSRILCCQQYSSVSEEITDLQGLCVIAHTIQGTASPNCPHVRTILVAPREFHPPAECLCAKTFAGT